MFQLKVPDWVRQHLFEYDPANLPQQHIDRIRDGLTRFREGKPEVSIVIPSYNEEANLLNTLSSLSMIKTKYPTELIVSNNNSTDRTQDILDTLGVKSVFETNQGISWARQSGLEAAKGTYIMNADSDSIYPPNWIDPYVEALKDPKVVCVYGRYKIIPGDGYNRLGLTLHETAAKMAFKRRKGRKEAINVMGFNFAYRKEDAMKIGGFKHDLDRAVTGRSEDGWMAWELYELGKIKLVEHKDKVWTSDRRLQEDGGMAKAFYRRVKRILSNK